MQVDALHGTHPPHAFFPLWTLTATVRSIGCLGRERLRQYFFLFRLKLRTQEEAALPVDSSCWSCTASTAMTLLPEATPRWPAVVLRFSGSQARILRVDWDHLNHSRTLSGCFHVPSSVNGRVETSHGDDGHLTVDRMDEVFVMMRVGPEYTAEVEMGVSSSNFKKAVFHLGPGLSTRHLCEVWSAAPWGGICHARAYSRVLSCAKQGKGVQLFKSGGVQGPGNLLVHQPLHHQRTNTGD